MTGPPDCPVCGLPYYTHLRCHRPDCSDGRHYTEHRADDSARSAERREVPPTRRASRVLGTLTHAALLAGALAILLHTIRELIAAI